MTKLSSRRAPSRRAAPRGMMARVLASATGRIWYRSPCWTAAMPFWRRIWLKSGNSSLARDLAGGADRDLALDARIERVADAQRGREAVDHLADVGALEVEHHRLVVAERALRLRSGRARRRCVGAGAGSAAGGLCLRQERRSREHRGDAHDRQHPLPLHCHPPPDGERTPAGAAGQCVSDGVYQLPLSCSSFSRTAAGRFGLGGGTTGAPSARRRPPSWRHAGDAAGAWPERHPRRRMPGTPARPPRHPGLRPGAWPGWPPAACARLDPRGRRLGHRGGWLHARGRRRHAASRGAGWPGRGGTPGAPGAARRLAPPPADFSTASVRVRDSPAADARRDPARLDGLQGVAADLIADAQAASAGCPGPTSVTKALAVAADHADADERQVRRRPDLLRAAGPSPPRVGFWRLGSNRSLFTMVVTSTVGLLGLVVRRPACLRAGRRRPCPPPCPRPFHRRRRMRRDLDRRQGPPPRERDLQPEQEDDDAQHAVEDRPASRSVRSPRPAPPARAAAASAGRSAGASARGCVVVRGLALAHRGAVVAVVASLPAALRWRGATRGAGGAPTCGPGRLRRRRAGWCRRRSARRRRGRSRLRGAGAPVAAPELRERAASERRSRRPGALRRLRAP